MSGSLSLVMAASVAPAGGGGGGSFGALTEFWTSAGNGQAPGAPWTVGAGTPTEQVVLSEGDLSCPGGSSSWVILDAVGVNGTIEFRRSDNSGGGGFAASGSFDFVIFRSNAARTNYCILQNNASTHKLEFSEWDGASTTNLVVGTFTTPSDNTAFGLKIVIAGASLTIQVDSGSGYVTDITATMVQFLTATHIAIGSAGGGPVIIGPVRIGP